MNKVRRKQLEEIQTELELLNERLGSLLDEEQQYYENMPESFQGGEKGEKSQAAIDAMESAVSTMEDVASSILEAIES